MSFLHIPQRPGRTQTGSTCTGRFLHALVYPGNRSLLTAVILSVTSLGPGFFGLAEVSAQSLDGSPRKRMTATRITGVSIDFDGRLDEPAWDDVIMVSDFLQKEPNEGAVPGERTEIGILYDDDAVYIGARMYSDDPGAIRMDLNRRDNPGNSEQIIVSLDTYLDRRTCYEFGVSAAGVRTDRYHSTDNEFSRDMSYNPVWDARTHVDEHGWTAEMRIPFSQLRFNRQEQQVWGININRWIPARREDNFWIYVPRDETGWSSRFGDLVGINGVAPSRRLELAPYMAGDGKFISETVAGDPFEDGSDLGSRMGADLKMGLGPNLTLDATINPDFGQVEADPAEVNLSAFETFFREQRPFFTEGSQLFSVSGPAYFYSRRVGASPHGYAEGDFVSVPNNTTILGASKVTGRLNSGTSLGILSALTSRETARTFNSTTGERGHTEVEPVTGFGVLRLQQEFGKDRSTAGILLTGVERDLETGEPLSDILRKRAFSGGADWRLRFAGGKYDIVGYTGFSHIEGSKEAILSAQESSARYYQRPDADYVTLDPTRTSLSGYTGSVRGGKRSGKHWLWGGGFALESPGFELNDAGILRSADDIDAWANIRYRETTPGTLFRSYRVSLFANSGWNFGGDRQYANLNLNINATFANYYSIWLAYELNPRAQSDNLTRGGPSMGKPRGFFAGGGISNNFSANTRYSANIFYSEDEDGEWNYDITGELSTRAGTRWQVSVEPEYRRSVNVRQYVDSFDNGPDATFGRRYVFATIDQSQLALQFRLNYFFTPDLSLEIYAEPFAASGRYSRFGELTAARARTLRVYGEAEGTSISETAEDGTYEVVDGDTLTIEQSDFGFRSFRSNFVLKWEFRRGSTLFLVWQQNRSGDDEPGRLVGPKALGRTLSSSGDNFLALKISYWIPVS